VLVAKTPRGRQAEMCDYLAEEESLHGNFFELKKKAKKNAKKMEKTCKQKAKKNANPKKHAKKKSQK